MTFSKFLKMKTSESQSRSFDNCQTQKTQIIKRNVQSVVKKVSQMELSFVIVDIMRKIDYANVAR